MTRDRYESLEYDGRLYDGMRRIESENEHLQKELKEKDKEIERLNNIINELENHCETMLSIFEQMTDEDKQKELHKYLIYDDFLTRLKRLKGDSSND